MPAWALAGGALPLSSYVAPVANVRHASRNCDTRAPRAEAERHWSERPCMRRPISAGAILGHGNKAGSCRRIGNNAGHCGPSRTMLPAKCHTSMEADAPRSRRHSTSKLCQTPVTAGQSPTRASPFLYSAGGSANPLSLPTEDTSNLGAYTEQITADIGGTMQCDHAREQPRLQRPASATDGIRAAHPESVSKSPEFDLRRRCANSTYVLSNVACLGPAAEAELSFPASRPRPVSATTLRPRGEALDLQLRTGLGATLVHNKFDVFRRQCMVNSLKPEVTDSATVPAPRLRTASRPQSAPAGPVRVGIHAPS